MSKPVRETCTTRPHTSTAGVRGNGAFGTAATWRSFIIKHNTLSSV